MTWLQNHKALVSALAVAGLGALNAAAGVAPPPYGEILLAAATALAALSRGVQPAAK
jgi:hypothetical protein